MKGVFSPTPKQPPLTARTGKKKPELLYIGAEYCPYCAASRWPLIIALSRFGTFKGLRDHRLVTRGQLGEHADLELREGDVHEPVPRVRLVELVANVCAVALVSNACPNDNY